MSIRIIRIDMLRFFMMSSLLPKGLLAAFALIAGLGVASTSSAAESAVEAKAKQVWQLLDYVAVDYGGAVSKGAVLKASEYAEMQEFASAAERQLSELPPGDVNVKLQAQAAHLRSAIAEKAEPAAVAQLAHGLAGDVLKAYPFSVAPAGAPDLPRGAQLFQAQCATCHGPQGRGDGPLAPSLDPKPTALADHVRARERSLFALHQIITNGVNGTPMASFGALPEDDRWALAFFVGTLPYAEADAAAGAELWKSSSQARQAVPGLDALT